MKRLRRIIFNGLAALSLVLCAAMVGLWVRSYFVTDRAALVRFSDEGNTTFETWDELRAGKGGIGFNRLVQSGDRATYRASTHRMYSRSSPGTTLGLRDLSFWYRAVSPGYPDFKFFNVTGDPSVYGFKWGRFSQTAPGARRPTHSGIYVVIPIWLVVVLTLPIPLVWIRKWQRRRKPGQCQVCGYDLRATPDRCPECGTIPAKP